MIYKIQRVLFCFIFLLAAYINSRLPSSGQMGMVMSADNKILAVYQNSQDFTQEYIHAEEEFRQRILEVFPDDSLVIQFCHFQDKDTMTAEFTWKNREYCLLLKNGTINWN